MRALDIMIFLLIFNVMISLVGALSIYNMNLEPSESQLTAEGMRNNQDIYAFIGGLAGVMIVSAVGGAFIGVIANRPIAEGASYGFFAGLISSVFVSSYGVLSQLIQVVPAGAQQGVQIVVGLFLAITGLMFALGFMQLIRGGVESYM